MHAGVIALAGEPSPFAGVAEVEFGELDGIDIPASSATVRSAVVWRLAVYAMPRSSSQRIIAS